MKTRIDKIHTGADRGWSVFIRYGGNLNGMFKFSRAELVRAYNSLWVKPGEWKRAQRRGDVRAERVVLITETDFNYLLGVAKAAETESKRYCRPKCSCGLCLALYPAGEEDAHA